MSHNPTLMDVRARTRREPTRHCRSSLRLSGSQSDMLRLRVGGLPGLDEIVRAGSQPCGFCDRVWVLDKGKESANEYGPVVEGKLKNLKARRGDPHDPLLVTIKDVLPGDNYISPWTTTTLPHP